MKLGIRCEECDVELNFRGDISTCPKCGEVLNWKPQD
jgi:hypothetical protein